MQKRVKVEWSFWFDTDDYEFETEEELKKFIIDEVAECWYSYGDIEKACTFMEGE